MCNTPWPGLIRQATPGTPSAAALLREHQGNRARRVMPQRNPPAGLDLLQCHLGGVPVRELPPAVQRDLKLQQTDEFIFRNHTVGELSAMLGEPASDLTVKIHHRPSEAERLHEMEQLEVDAIAKMLQIANWSTGDVALETAVRSAYRRFVVAEKKRGSDPAVSTVALKSCARRSRASCPLEVEELSRLFSTTWKRGPRPLIRGRRSLPTSMRSNWKRHTARICASRR